MFHFSVDVFCFLVLFLNGFAFEVFHFSNFVDQCLFVLVDDFDKEVVGSTLSVFALGVPGLDAEDTFVATAVAFQQSRAIDDGVGSVGVQKVDELGSSDGVVSTPDLQEYFSVSRTIGLERRSFTPDFISTDIVTGCFWLSLATVELDCNVVSVFESFSFDDHSGLAGEGTQRGFDGVNGIGRSSDAGHIQGHHVPQPVVGPPAEDNESTVIVVKEHGRVLSGLGSVVTGLLDKHAFVVVEVI